MGDELERFITQNREAFDTEIPDEKIWNRIRSKTGSGNHMLKWWKIAAVLFLLSTVYLLVERNLGSPYTRDHHSTGEVAEFVLVEDYYSQLIAEKTHEINQYDRGHLKVEFLREIDRLDEMYAGLKETFKNQNSTDLLVDAMISNLKLRIEILDQQITILEKLKAIENEKDSNIEI